MPRVKDCACGTCRVTHTAGRGGTSRGYRTDSCRCCSCRAYKRSENARRTAGPSTPQAPAPRPVEPPTAYLITDAPEPRRRALPRGGGPVVRRDPRTSVALPASGGDLDLRADGTPRGTPAHGYQRPTTGQINDEITARRILFLLSTLDTTYDRFARTAAEWRHADGRRGLTLNEQAAVLEFIARAVTSNTQTLGQLAARRNATSPAGAARLTGLRAPRAASSGHVGRIRSYKSTPGLADPGSIAQQARGEMIPPDGKH